VPAPVPEITDGIERCTCPDCLRQMPWRKQYKEQRDKQGGKAPAPRPKRRRRKVEDHDE